MGELGAEFGSVPDGAEDSALQALGEGLSGSFTGKPGKKSSAIISTFISQKLPGGFNQSAAREYLKTNWGVGESMQPTLLLFAATAQPAARIGDAGAAKEFLDSVVAKYSSTFGVSLSQGGGGVAGAAGDAGPSIAIDAAGLDALKSEQKEYLLKQFDVLGKFLKIDGNVPTEKIAELEATVAETEDKLSRWSNEFDEEFYTGIQSTFDPKKSRMYDSWWNWVRLDLIHLFQELSRDKISINEIEQDPRFTRILNRWSSSCADLLNYYLSKSKPGPYQERLSQLVHKMVHHGSVSAKMGPVYKYSNPVLAPKTTVLPSGEVKYTEVPRKAKNGSTHYADLIREGRVMEGSGERMPFCHLRSTHLQEWKFDADHTELFLDVLAAGCERGLNFTGMTVLITGAGPNSIGCEIVRGLLSGGARVIITTSRQPSATAEFYNSLYKTHGAQGSRLTILPFNQASKKDCGALIDHIYSSDEYGGDLDFVIPFAAIPETGRQLDALDYKSELAHRIMLVNVLRLLGNIKAAKERRGLDTRPTNVILPLSPNHGTFGGDGLYSESKIGLETLFNRFRSESWANYLTVCGAVIGWTRGTGLMGGNNIVAEAIESKDVITFSQTEMAFNILALMTPAVTSLSEEEPVYADLNGGLQFVENLKDELSAARARILDESRLRRALVAEEAQERLVLHGPAKESKDKPIAAQKKRANLTVGYPDLKDHAETIQDLPDLLGMVDLRRTIVVVGYSELGPWGSARTRWEMEHLGEFTMEGYIEMAWIMGLIKHFEGEIKGQTYVGWVDAESKQPVPDDEIPTKYREHILNHSGVRFVEPEGAEGYDPNKKELLHEVAVEEDLPTFEASRPVAEAFKLRHGDSCSIQPIIGSDDFKVQVRKGATMLLPKAVKFDRLVAGQLPKGFSPETFGIPKDIIQQCDPVTVYALCCVCQAMSSAGIKDPLELYKYLHVSELANCLGTGSGNLLSMRGVYRDRYLDRPVASDMLQESFLNAMGAWANMLLLASAGPIKSPTGTCATAIESLDIAAESILTGKCKAAIVGGSDDFQEELSYEFANMKATASAIEELDKGRLPHEISRPTATSRAGFVESAGCGVQIVMHAELAIEMGLPIYGVIAHSQMAGDKIGRSVPAPGQGVLTAAKEAPGAHRSPLLDLDYRRKNLRDCVIDVHEWRAAQLAELAKQGDDASEEHKAAIEDTAACKIRDAQYRWGNDFRRQNPGIAPVRAALAVWGLTVDDIQVCTLHGTSTKANDKNETDVISKQMAHLGRSRGNPLFAIAQKALTGHPKGAAGAWMLHGGLQVLQTGIIPGNRNADNLDAYLQPYEHVVYPGAALHTRGIKAFMLTSFGFGQKGGFIVCIAPRYLFAALRAEVYDAYRQRAERRQRRAEAAWIEGLMHHRLFNPKSTAPWDGGESRFFLDPNARLTQDEDRAGGAFRFDPAASFPNISSRSHVDYIDPPNLSPGQDPLAPSTHDLQRQQRANVAWISPPPASQLPTPPSPIRALEPRAGSIDAAIPILPPPDRAENEDADQGGGASASGSGSGPPRRMSRNTAARWSAREAIMRSLRADPGAEINAIGQEGWLSPRAKAGRAQSACVADFLPNGKSANGGPAAAW